MHVVMNPAVTNSAWFVCHDKSLNQQCITRSGSPHDDAGIILLVSLPSYIARPSLTLKYKVGEGLADVTHEMLTNQILNEEKGYLLPTIAQKITCRRFD